MKNGKLLLPILSGVAVSLIVFMIIIQILGVPLWWLFRGLVPLSGVELNHSLGVEVSPAVPSNIGDNVVVIVRDTFNHSLVSGATVSVYKDSGFIRNYYTDDEGTIAITYVGEVTIISVEKDGYKGSMQAIPQVPDKYVREQNNAIIGALAGGFPSAILVFILQYKFMNPKKTTRRRKKQ